MFGVATTPILSENDMMENNRNIPPEIMAEMEEAVKNALARHRDPAAMRKACERMDRMREAIFKRHGLLDIGVPAIRELREDP